MYNIVKFLLPILDKCSGIISLFFFIFWIIQMKYRRYIIYLEFKAKNEFDKRENDILKYNQQNPFHQIASKTSWINIYEYYMSKRYNSLFVSLVFAYISFNVSSYYESSNDNFYKLLGVSTTLFLAGITYIQRNTQRK